MKRIFSLLMLAFIASYTSMASIYTFIPGQYDWSAAKSDAEWRGGHLATITSSTEWADLLAQTGVLPGDVWLGGVKSDNEWKWITGESMAYQNWAPGEPSEFGVYGAENYIVAYGASGLWNDAPGFSITFYDAEHNPIGYSPLGYILEGDEFDSTGFTPSVILTRVPDSGSSVALFLGGMGSLAMLRRKQIFTE
jgi:hypothetical protein